MLIGYWKVFWEIINCNCVIFYGIKRFNINMFVCEIDVFVDFICDDENIIVGSYNISYIFKFSFGINWVCGIIGRRKEYCFCMIGNSGL